MTKPRHRHLGPVRPGYTVRMDSVCEPHMSFMRPSAAAKPPRKNAKQEAPIPDAVTRQFAEMRDVPPGWGLAIRKQRSALGLTLARVAKKLGIPLATLAGWEIRTPKKTTVDRYITTCEFLGIQSREEETMSQPLHDPNVRVLLYWLLRVYLSYEDNGPSESPEMDDLMDEVYTVLCNFELNPHTKLVRRLAQEDPPGNGPV